MAGAWPPPVDHQPPEVLMRLPGGGPPERGAAQRHLDALLERGPRTLEVDLSEISHLSSTTVTTLLWIQRRCSVRGVRVVICAASNRNFSALRRIGLVAVESTAAGSSPARGPDR
ncbi:hypothetical protein PD653_3496 [Nocardioides sp. PD653]|nr:hypothetical protein PD653B2_4604 [Nocardioides sp. PD653-B2]GAW56063.1 hypothetical protein PD653_3496 [Nocardioides sp. PD653]